MNTNEQLNTDKPLFNIIRNLVNVSSNTTIENSQLVNILSLEFNLPINDLSDLAIDIYMCTLKKFLKSWPRWDEFDKMMREKEDPVDRELIIQEEYVKLKQHLQNIIEMVKMQSEPILKKIENRKKKINSQNKIKMPPEKGELMMEVACTRDQLNRLFYRKPHPETLTIFNISEEPTTSRISLEEITFREVLNWPHINTTIILPNFEFVRRNSSHFERTLINRKLPQNFTVEPLPTDLFINTKYGRKNFHDKNTLISYLILLIKSISNLKMPNSERQNHLVYLFNEVKSDMLLMVNQMISGCEYQFFMSQYAYVRYLFEQNFSNDVTMNSAIKDLKKCINPNDFDLYLEEKISPAMKFEMPKFSVPLPLDASGRALEIDCNCLQDATNNWLRFECTWCDVKFDGFLAIYHLLSHLNTHHSNEPDWQCLKCNKTFTMKSLCANRWFHVC